MSAKLGNHLYPLMKCYLSWWVLSLAGCQWASGIVEGLNACTATARDRNQTSFIFAEEFWLFATLRHQMVNAARKNSVPHDGWRAYSLLSFGTSLHTRLQLSTYWNSSFICTSSDSDPPLCVRVLHDSAAFPHFPVSLCSFSYPCCSQEQRVSRIIPWLHLEPFSKWDKTVKARNFLKESQCSVTHDQGTHGHYRATNWPRLCRTSFLNLYCVEFTSSFTTSWIRYVNEHPR